MAVPGALRHQRLQEARNSRPVTPPNGDSSRPAFRGELATVLISVLVQQRPAVNLAVVEGALADEVQETFEEPGMKDHRLGRAPGPRAEEPIVRHPNHRPNFRPVHWIVP